jgi:hypothetical protein
VKIGRFAKDGAGLGEPSHKATADA